MVAAWKETSLRTPSLVPIELLVSIPDAPSEDAIVRVSVEKDGQSLPMQQPLRLVRIGLDEFHVSFAVPRGARVRLQIMFVSTERAADTSDEGPALERLVDADCGSLLLLTVNSTACRTQ
jgi:hypothetical protein